MTLFEAIVMKAIEGTQEKNMGLFGDFSWMADPPPLLGTPFSKQILVFILHFRNIFGFYQTLKFGQYFYIDSGQNNVLLQS